MQLLQHFPELHLPGQQPRSPGNREMLESALLPDLKLLFLLFPLLCPTHQLQMDKGIMAKWSEKRGSCHGTGLRDKKGSPEMC